MHKPVLVKEVLDNLHINSQSRIIDATEGAGGHTLQIVKLGGKVLGIDADPKMLDIARNNLKGFESQVRLVNVNFKDIDKIAKQEGFENVDGILFDLGISSFHLDDFKRGFSFKEKDSILDMRLNPDLQAVKGCDLLNMLREDQLRELFKTTLTEPESVRLARKIIDVRLRSEIKTVGQFKEIIGTTASKARSLNPETLAFLALRIAVNSELDSLRQALPKAFSLLKENGVLLIISFHSGEDTIAKKFVNEKSELVLPNKEEIDENSRARSAKLRIFKK